MSNEHRASRGRQAAQEWSQTEAAFAEVEAAILRTLAETPVGQETKVLNLHKAVQNLAAVRQAIRAVIDDGMMAEHAIAQAGLTRPN
jgi:hypothetical protein